MHCLNITVLHLVFIWSVLERIFSYIQYVIDYIADVSMDVAGSLPGLPCLTTMFLKQPIMDKLNTGAFLHNIISPLR